MTDQLPGRVRSVCGSVRWSVFPHVHASTLLKAGRWYVSLLVLQTAVGRPVPPPPSAPLSGTASVARQTSLHCAPDTAGTPPRRPALFLPGRTCAGGGGSGASGG